MRMDLCDVLKIVCCSFSTPLDGGLIKICSGRTDDLEDFFYTHKSVHSCFKINNQLKILFDFDFIFFLDFKHELQNNLKMPNWISKAF